MQEKRRLKQEKKNKMKKKLTVIGEDVLEEVGKAQAKRKQTTFQLNLQLDRRISPEQGNVIEPEK